MRISPVSVSLYTPGITLLSVLAFLCTPQVMSMLLWLHMPCTAFGFPCMCLHMCFVMMMCVCILLGCCGSISAGCEVDNMLHLGSMCVWVDLLCFRCSARSCCTVFIICVSVTLRVVFCCLCSVVMYDEMCCCDSNALSCRCFHW